MRGREDYFFVDTNIIVYCFDDANPDKKVKAISIMNDLWESRKGVLTSIMHENVLFDLETLENT